MSLQESSPSVINRTALGRVARIGALYDVRTEQFLHDSVFSSRIDEGSVDRTELSGASVELVMSDNIEDKFHKLNIEAELQASLLAGLVQLSGSGSYLSEENDSARTQSMSLVYKIRTVNEEFVLRQNKEKIELDIFKAGKDLSGTHVVVAIDWGAVCSITCQCENAEGKDETIVKGALGVRLEKLKELVRSGGSTQLEYRDDEEEKLENFTFKCTSDVSTTDNDIPTTFEGALELARNLPKIVRQTNGGKGVPVLYRLMPLEAVTKMCQLQLTLELHYSNIREDTIKRVSQTMQSIIKKRQELFDVQKDLHRFKDLVNESSLYAINKYMDDINVHVSTFKSKLQKLVTKIRRQEANVSSLDHLLREIIGKTSPLAKYDQYIRQFQGELSNVYTIMAWEKRDIIYIRKKQEFIVDDADTMYVLYKPELKQSQENEEFFLQYQKLYSKEPGTTFKVIDENIRPDIWGDRESKGIIEEYKFGRKTCKDVYERECKSTQMCLVRLERPGYCQRKPPKKENVKIRCPNSFSGTRDCSGDPIIWKCEKCKELLEYGLKTSKFYCKCGISEPSKALFRCNESNHGIVYLPYPEEILHAELSRLQVKKNDFTQSTLIGDDINCREKKERNILILGQIGVGKSTWINGIVNYFSFSDLYEAAEANDFPVLIPSKFMFTKEGRAVEIGIGEISGNEMLRPGHSSTRETRLYVFTVGDLKIRLIDTPGIGDCRGIKQERNNFYNTLSYLTYYEEIHAVCILLEPNCSKVYAMFRFCILELLSLLHISAKKNIVFCVTNARGTFYQPGDTLSSLNKLFEEEKMGIRANSDNCFIFDNEAFRFLACLHNKITFSNEDIKTYAESWERARDETKKLFGFISELPPLHTRDILSINEARLMIVAISELIAGLEKTIQEKCQKAKVLQVNSTSGMVCKYDEWKKGFKSDAERESFMMRTMNWIINIMAECKKKEDGITHEIQAEKKLILGVWAEYKKILKYCAIFPKEEGQTVGDILRDKCYKENQILDGVSSKVMELQEQLFNLKHFGGTLKAIFDEISKPQSSRPLPEICLISFK